VSAPVRVAARLREHPDGPVEIVHRGRHAIYLDLGGWCLGVVGSVAVAVPCALRLAFHDLGGLPSDTASVRGGVLHLGDTAVRIGRLVDVSVPRQHRRPLDASSRTVGPQERAMLDDVGRGPGLTPEADDVLCGWVAMHRSAGVATPELDDAVLARLGRTTLLSATLLECAVHGEVIPEFAAFVEALGTPTEADRAAALGRLGHTSGAALLRGARAALSDLSPERALMT
jgi:hypothetical protein